MLDTAIEQNGHCLRDTERATKLATLKDTLNQFFYNGNVETGPKVGCTPTQQNTLRQLLFLLCDDMQPADLESQSALFHLKVPHGDIDKIIQHIAQYLCFAQPLSAPSKIALHLAHLRASFVDMAAGTLFDHLRQTPLGKTGVDESLAASSVSQFAPNKWRADYQLYSRHCSADFLSLAHGQLLTPLVDEESPHNNPDFLSLLPDETLFKMLFTGGALKSHFNQTEIRGFLNAYNPQRIVKHLQSLIKKHAYLVNPDTEPDTNAVIASAQLFAPWKTMTAKEMRTEGYILGEEFGTGVSADFMLDYLTALGYLEHRNA